jgi:hypothetical protein
MFGRCKHSWVVVSSRIYEKWFYPYNSPYQRIPRGNGTKVLLKCETCGDIKMKEIKGRFTTEELRGEMK